MHLDALKNELQVASKALLELRRYIFLYHSASLTSWHSSRCGRCEQYTFQTLHYHHYPYRSDRSAKELLASNSFEILDGFCTICGNDDLWQRLCRIDPTRDTDRAKYDPFSHKQRMCPVCLSDSFDGIMRGTYWTGACNDCHVLFGSRKLRRSVRENLAAVSRTRRELRRHIRRIESQISNYSTASSTPFLDDADFITLPPSSG